LAMSLMGHPGYNFKFLISNFKFQINGTDMFGLLPEERAKMGLFVSFQSPVEITGVSLLAFLRTAHKALHPDKKIPLSQFRISVKEALQKVGLDESFMQRSVNEGFSGGERKRAEMAQLLVLKPKYAILDEIDSGLDVDSLKIVAKAVADAVKKHNVGVLLITHYQRILRFLKPDKVHVLIDGKIKKSGKMSLVRAIEKEGYAAV
ncbi:MAG: Fe-S cluster assembly ATPase SufC, partial [Candidatus Levybacteria bacterium]|nr:Fe-S cluster assembly ATPase SufC [Candidatus Levybacteria bacterium]